jgi:Flp pilus assembly pilin Flp
MRILGKLLKNDRGATAIEFALIGSMISIAAVVAFDNLGNAVDNRYSAVDQALHGSI